MNAKQPTLAQIRRNFKIDTVMERTGCTYEQARKELIAEEWNVADAIINLRQAKAQGRI